MSPKATQPEIDHVVDRVRECGFQAHVVQGVERTIIGAVGNDPSHRYKLEALRAASGVESVVPISHPFKLVSQQFKQGRTIVEVGGIPVGGDEVVIIAGPCSVESREQLLESARGVRNAGAHMLRGGAYKPRTSPYDFQGLGIEALRILKEAREETGLPVVTEVMAAEDIDLVSEYADMLQIGARNMQNYPLLRSLGKAKRPVLLKRGPSATIKEWLLAAEYILANGNPNVVLCERGIKTFSDELRNTMDLGAVALVKELSHLPVIVDPSHATGKRSLVPAASRAALGVGADGLIIEVHPCPERAMSDGAQSLDIDEFARLVGGLEEPTRKLARTALAVH